MRESDITSYSIPSLRCSSWIYGMWEQRPLQHGCQLHLGAWKGFPCREHHASIPPCLDSCGLFASIRSNTSTWTIATVLFFKAAWKLQENKRQNWLCPMSNPGVGLRNALFCLKLSVFDTFAWKQIILVIIIAAKCPKPSLLQIDTIYWADWFQFSRYFSRHYLCKTLFCVDTKDDDQENPIL